MLCMGDSVQRNTKDTRVALAINAAEFMVQTSDLIERRVRRILEEDNRF
jgi:hypothetical protein